MKIAVSVPDELFREAEAAAKSLRMSRSRLYSAALFEFLEERRPKDVTERLNEVYAKRSARVDDALSRMQWAALPEEEW